MRGVGVVGEWSEERGGSEQGVPDANVNDGFWTPGDVFIDLDCDGIYDYALAHTFSLADSPGLWSNPTYEGISDEPGSYGGPGNFNQDVVDQAGAWMITAAFPAGGAVLDVQSHNYGGDENGTFVWEWTVDLGAFDFIVDEAGTPPFDPNKIALHWTIECGNDLIEVPKVPEPATLLLLSSGLAGLAMLRRRKR